MDKKNKALLKKQLEQQAEQILTQDDVGMSISIFSSCNVLIRMAEKISKVNLTEDELENIYSGYLGLAKRMIHFYENCLEDEWIANISAFEDLKTQMESALATQKKYETAKEENEEFQRQINEYKTMLESEERLGERLRAQLESCSPDIIEIKKTANQQLLLQVASRTQELEDLNKKAGELKDENERTARDVQDMQALIDALPRENAQLYEQYQGLKTLLGELQKAEIECSVERQQELQAQINALTPVVGELQVAVDTLSNRINSLNEQQIIYDEKKQRLSTTVLELIEDSLEDLEGILIEHEASLLKIKETADTLAFKISECQKIREEYKNWFDVYISALEAMIAALEYPENVSLRETLDVGQVSAIRGMMEQTGRNLEALDQILSKCAQTAQVDLERIRRRAHP